MTLRFVEHYSKYIYSRRGIMLISALLVILCLFFIAPIFGVEGFLSRIVFIVLIVLSAAIIWLSIKMWKTDKFHSLYKFINRNKILSAEQVNFNIIKTKLKNTIQLMKDSNLRLLFWKGRAINALPWYILIGPKNAGKSTLIKTSGLNFTLPESHNLNQDNTINNNVEFYCANEMILVDIAGDYAFAKNKKTEWLYLLKLLRRYHREIPLNGVVITFPLDEILTLSQEELEQRINLIRQQVMEIYSNLRFTIPVYLILTKFDTLSGFSKFFATLDMYDREQNFVIQLSNAEAYSDKMTAFSQQYKLLYEKLNQLCLSNIAFANNLSEKFNIFSLPQAFLDCENKIYDFVNAFCKTNLYSEPIKLFGIYFTSAKQLGTDVTMISKQESNQYFIKELFKKVLPDNQRCYELMPEFKRLLNIAKISLVSLGIIFMVFSMFCYARISSSNTRLLTGTKQYYQRHLTKIYKPSEKYRKRIRQITNLYQYYLYATKNKYNLNFWQRLGLYRGSSLKAAMQYGLIKAISTYALPIVVHGIINKLQHYHLQWSRMTETARQRCRHKYYSLLQAYLMLHIPERINPTLISQTLSLQLSKLNIEGNLIKFYLTAIKKQQQHEDYFISSGIGDLDNAIVKKAREDLGSTMHIDDIYSLFVTQAKQKWLPVAINTLLNTDAFDEHIKLSTLYTRQAWQSYVHSAINEFVAHAKYQDWVLSLPLNISVLEEKLLAPQVRLSKQQQIALKEKLYTLYIHHYYQAWYQLMQRLKLRAVNNLSAALLLQNQVIAKHGLLLKLLTLIANNVDIHSQAQQDKVLIASLHSRFRPLINSFSKIRIHYELLRNKILLSYLHSLGELRDKMTTVSMSPNRQTQLKTICKNTLVEGQATSDFYKTVLSTEKLLKTYRQTSIMPALKHVLLLPTTMLWQTLVGQVMQSIQQQWQAQVYSYYQNNIANYFPFNPHGDDLSLQQFDDFFKPNSGILWQFINNKLAIFLVRKNNTWQVRKWLGINPEFDPVFLQDLNQATLLAQSVFPNNASSAHVSFRIYPMPTIGISEITLETAGQLFHYENGPQQWHSLSWPTKTLNPFAQLTAIVASNNQQLSLSTSGAWAIWHLFKKAKISSQNNSNYVLRWRFMESLHHRYSISLLLHVRNQDLLKLLLIKPFHLPSQIAVSKY